MGGEGERGLWGSGPIARALPKPSHTPPSLQLGENRITSFDCLAPLAALPALSVLYLERNPLAADFEYRMRIAKAMPRLRQIDATEVLRRDGQ